MSQKVLNKEDEIINPATEETLQSIAGLNIPAHDNGSATYNDTTFTDVFTFKLGVTTVCTVTLVYSDVSRIKLVSWTKA